jgi:addiction module RelE/StbE family toxin
MAKSTYKVIWSNTAKNDLKDIHDFIKQKSEQGAKNVIADIRKAAKSLHFSKQTQIEKYLPACRRIIVRNYKILYTTDDSKKELYVVRVFDTRRNPATMKQ